jgi:two-component system response regulator HydG
MNPPGPQQPRVRPRHEPRVLIADDQLAMAEMIADQLAEIGYAATPVGSGQEAARRLREEEHDALVTDLRMPDVDGLELLALSRRLAPDRPVIVMTAFSAVDTAVESIRQGAYHYITKPFKVAELALFLGRALDEAELRRESRSLKRALRTTFALSAIVGESAAIRDLRDLLVRVADADVPVLLLGETGTGKDLAARALHAESPRCDRAFVTVNCAALPEQLLESEFFGHVKGSFTGATHHRTGLFVEADGGTLFLDEIGELAPALQGKLLQVLETGMVRAVGSNRERPVDVRVIAATHRDLRARVVEGLFREDLLYRLDVISVPIPPLRQRREDIPLLLEHFLAAARARYPKTVVERFSPEAARSLIEYFWPGNVRELKHVIERAVLLGRAPEISPADLGPAIADRASRAGEIHFGSEVLPMREMQRRYAAWALEQLGGRKMLTCEKLGIDSKTLARWLAEEPADT